MYEENSNMKIGKILLMGVIFLLSAMPALTNEKKWNFLVIVVDDLGQMDISPNNPNTFYKTPNLEQLAKESVRFSHNYSASPVCSPARVALMTGRQPARIKATDWSQSEEGQGRAETYKGGRDIQHMPIEEVTWAEALKTKG